MEILNIFQTLGFCEDSRIIWKFIGSILNIIQIAIPVIIILLGTLDLGKAVMAGEDKKIKEAQKMLIMRIIYGVAIFFVVTIVQIIFNFVGDAQDKTTGTCWKCVADAGDC